MQMWHNACMGLSTCSLWSVCPHAPTWCWHVSAACVTKEHRSGSVWGWQRAGDGGMFGEGESLLCGGGVRNQGDRG